MGLLDLSKLENEHLNLAKHLSQSLITAQYRKQKLDLSLTCQCIDKLCSRHTKSKVYDVLEWYISQCGQEFSVEVSSIKDLERKFPKIYKRYFSKNNKLSEEELPDIKVGLWEPYSLLEGATKVLVYSGTPSFPDDFNGVEYLKRCLFFIDDFQKRLKIVEQHPEQVGLEVDSRTHKLVNFIRSRYIDPIQFCVNWLKRILPIIWKVEHYNYKSLFPLMGSSPIFESMMREEARKFCADESEWVAVKFYLGKAK